ncbi:MAG TPA: hypothetical protein PLX39_13605, partial [Pyrinomonadaceae bacterium]|nr:hypothetical protein [Pyrinomonadaceae bacterium]
RASNVAVSVTFSRSLAVRIAVADTHSFTLANTTAGSSKFSSMGVDHSLQWFTVRQRSRNWADIGRRDVVWDG